MSFTYTSRPLVNVTVPEEKRKGISNYAHLLSLAREYKLGDNASRDLFHKGSGLIAKVKPILQRNAVEPDGSFQRTWHQIDPIQQACLTEEVHKVMPWLQCFEGSWATKWILKSLINQRVHDGKRAKRRRQREIEMEEELAKWQNEHDEREMVMESANAVAEGKIYCLY